MDPEENSPTGEFPAALPPPLPPLPDPARRVVVDLGSLSHQGRVRKNTEAHYLVLRPSRALDILGTNLEREFAPPHIEQEGYIYIVADGLGGMAAGEYASMLAIRAGLASILRSDYWCFRPDRQSGPEQLRRIRGHYLQIDEILQQHARTSQSLQGMATTLTTIYTAGADAMLAHVGDSRAYLLREGRLRCLTRDHTIAQYLADSGVITADEVATHARRHVLMNFAGGPSGGIQPQIHPFQLADGDTLLLCTDGLTEMVEEATISSILKSEETAQLACLKLVDLALENGGADNVTVVAARYRIPFDPGPPWFLGWELGPALGEDA
ncbi:MAG: protein phosphatase 2C domain-containing protein [Isosphaeraceae bacterium]